MPGRIQQVNRRLRRVLRKAATAVLAGAHTMQAAANAPFEWRTRDLKFAYEFSGEKLRQSFLLPPDFPANSLGPAKSSGVETAIQLTGGYAVFIRAESSMKSQMTALLR